MPKSKTASSTRRLSEVARHVVFPKGIVTTAWPRVVAKCAEMGVTFDDWQHGIGAIALGKGVDGKYVSTVGGIVLSIPRQVGKTFLVGMIIIALCVIYPNMTVLWTAHRTRTATKTFGTLQGMVRKKKIAPYLAVSRNDGIRSANGEQEIKFKNGSIIMFGARERGFGRGFDRVDVEVFDEAQILGEKALEDMVPATNASAQPAGALLFFMGTPPRPSDPGEEFIGRRRDALAGDDQMVYVEFAADPDAKLDDHKQWAKANPSFPSRTSVEAMQRMRKNLKNDDSFRREALGIWDADQDGSEFPAGSWSDVRVDLNAPLSSPVVAMDFRGGVQPSLSLGVVGKSDLGPVALIATHEKRPGVVWSDDQIVAWVVSELSARGVDRIAIDSYGENGPLIPLLEEAGLDVVKFNTIDMRNACMSFHSAVLNKQVFHTGDRPLDIAAAGAKRRKVNDGWRWDRATSASDIGPLLAVAEAWWVFTTDPDYDVDDSFY